MGPFYITSAWRTLPVDEVWSLTPPSERQHRLAIPDSEHPGPSRARASRTSGMRIPSRRRWSEQSGRTSLLCVRVCAVVLALMTEPSPIVAIVARSRDPSSSSSDNPVHAFSTVIALR